MYLIAGEDRSVVVRERILCQSRYLELRHYFGKFFE